MFYFFYGMSLFGIILILIAVFETTRTAAIGGIVFNLIPYYLRYAIGNNTAMIWRIIASIVPSLNLYNANHVLWIVQVNRKITFSNMNYVSHNYSISLFIIMCLVDFVFWLLIGLYTTYVVPTEFGLRRHPCFCIM